MSDCCFSFMNCYLIWRVVPRAGTVFCKPPDQAHMFFSTGGVIAALIYHASFSRCLIFRHIVIEMLKYFKSCGTKQKPAVVLLLFIATVLCIDSCMQCCIHQNVFISSSVQNVAHLVNVKKQQVFILIYWQVWITVCCFLFWCLFQLTSPKV